MAQKSIRRAEAGKKGPAKKKSAAKWSHGMKRGEGPAKRSVVTRRPAAMARTGTIALVSASEEFIVMTYRCENTTPHPYYPPPRWIAGMKCWCDFEIVRED